MKIIYQEIYEDDVVGHSNEHEGGIILQMGNYVYMISHFYGTEYIRRQPVHCWENEGDNFEEADWFAIENKPNKRIEFKFLKR